MNLNSIRAAAVAMAIGLAVMTSPALANGAGIPFNFGFSTPDGFGFSIGQNGVNMQLPGMNGGNGNFGQRRNACMSTGAVIVFLPTQFGSPS